jgi:hypothetical protein
VALWARKILKVEDIQNFSSGCSFCSTKTIDYAGGTTSNLFANQLFGEDMRFIFYRL